MRYIFVTGGVLSSVGKGLVTSSIGKILQARGYRVTAIKIDPYLNYDSGTMNPYMHGEVFVTEDGGETDLDIGSYERMLDMDIPNDHNVTTGQVYLEVITRERRGDYLGKCVQIIPHVTDEVKSRIRRASEGDAADIALVEIGGTVGDIEGAPFLEAVRQMRLEEPAGHTLFVHVALVPTLPHTGEAKSKPLQHSVQELRRIGIQPDLVVARCVQPIPEELRAKIALFASVPRDSVFSSANVTTTYLLPRILDEQGLGAAATRRLGLAEGKPEWTTWDRVVEPMARPKHGVRIFLVGKYVELEDSYISVLEALRHAGAFVDTRVDIDLVEAEKVSAPAELGPRLAGADGFIVPGGFGTRGVEGKISAIGYARSRGIPFLGVCFGFQLAVVEFARSVAGMGGANTTEVDPSTPYPVIDMMEEQKDAKGLGGTMRLGASPVDLKEGTLAHRLYGRGRIYERHRHRYEVNPRFIQALLGHGLVFSGTTPDGVRMETLELPGHFYFFATQFHPEFKSRPGKPDPAYLGLVKAALDRSMGLSSLRLPEPWRYAAENTSANIMG